MVDVSTLDIGRPTRSAFWKTSLLVMQRLTLWHRNHRTRQHLGQLGTHQLADIGLTAQDRDTECKKWLWQK